MNSMLLRKKTRPKYKEGTKLSIMQGSFLWRMEKEAIEEGISITPKIFIEPLLYARQFAAW